MKNRQPSYDADVYILFNKFVVKKYKTAQQIEYLNRRLHCFYKRIPRGILPVAWHEWTAINRLYPYGIAPKPYFCGTNYVIMGYAGETIENLDYDKSMYYEQAKGVLKTLETIGFKHNDLLPRNICIKNGRIILIDFTMSEFDGVSIIEDMPNPNWAYPGDERLISYFE